MRPRRARLGRNGPRRLLLADRPVRAATAVWTEDGRLLGTWFTDANPSWSIQTGPVWSPDFTWDSGLLITTTGSSPRTRTLAEEASASPFGFDQPNFSILDCDLDLS